MSASRQRLTNLQDTASCQAAWKESFAQDAIDLRRLPTRSLVCKARAILAQMAAGVPYTRFRGKRFQSDRTVISVPLGRRYRLLFEDEGGVLCPLYCLSHEAYNHWRPHR
jgi:hypothetical protein